MPHVRENEPRPDDAQHPEGKLGGDPINAGETAPREAAPDPGGDTRPPEHQPGAVDGEPGSDL
jgi:hypothetical protein